MKAAFIFSFLSIFLFASGRAHESAHDRTVLAPGYRQLEYQAPKFGTYELPIIRIAEDATFIDSNNNLGSLSQLYDGKVTILSFIYTGCDDANGCPLATFVMSQLAKRMENDSAVLDHLQLVSFSFDLDKDTPEVLNNYATPFKTDRIPWAFVVAPNKKLLDETLANYGQSVQELAGHKYAHLLRVFLIDKNSRIRNIYSTSFLHAETMVNDVKTLLFEEGVEKKAVNTRRTLETQDGGDREETFADNRLGLPSRPGDAKSSAVAKLGAELFFDRRLSINNTVSCAMCHIPTQGFTSNDLGTSVGFEGRTVRRNAPTLLNVGYLKTLFHDNRENSLKQQVWSPLLAKNEMANPSIGFVISKLTELPGYKEKFASVFSEGITMVTIGKALAAYERSLIAGGSDFDHYYFAGEDNALTTSARRGLSLFQGKARCVSCHEINDGYALFTDQAVHNTGIGYKSSMQSKESKRSAVLGSNTILEFDLSTVSDSTEKIENDLGRYEITFNPNDRWRYRTPTLRNVALTAPYMHDGSILSLKDVVDFYSMGGVDNPLLDPLILPLKLSEQEKRDLVNFLESLTSRSVKKIIFDASTVSVGNP